METLKKVFGILLIGFCMITAFSPVIIAEETGKEKAFAESYTNEYAGQYGKAADSLKKVYNDNSYEINLRLGWLCYLSSSVIESANYYSKAIKILPYSVEARMGYVLPASSLGNWDEVINQYKEILKIDPKNSIVLYRLGLIYYNRNDFETAYSYVEKLANMYPFDYDTTILFAWTNYKLSKYIKAKFLFNKVLLINPRDASSLEGLSLIK